MIKKKRYIGLILKMLVMTEYACRLQFVSNLSLTRIKFNFKSEEDKKKHNPESYGKTVGGDERGRLCLNTKEKSLELFRLMWENPEMFESVTFLPWKEKNIRKVDAEFVNVIMLFMSNYALTKVIKKFFFKHNKY